MQSPVISAEYQITSNSCGGILDVGQHCALQIVFQPTASGDQPGAVTVEASGGAVHAQTTLDGSGLTPVSLGFTPASLTFPSTQQGVSSAQQSVTLTNSGGATAALAVPVITGDYAIASNSCGTTLAASATCVIAVTFKPTATGSRTGSLKVATTDASKSATVTLIGTGTAPAALILTPTSLVFTATAIGTTSAVQNITLANTGSSTLTTQPFTITGDFALSADTCSGKPLNPTYSCTLSIVFTPAAAGQRSGVLTVSDGTETHTAALTGTGLSPATDTLAPTSLTFGTQQFGTVSAAQPVTLTNSGGSTLNFISAKVTGPFVAANNCGTLLGGGLSCSIAVSFAPVGAGVETGQLVITDALQSQTVALTGTGVLPSSPTPAAVATPGSLSFGGFAIGVPSTAMTVTVNNTGSTQLNAFTAVTGTSSFAVSSNTCSSALAVGASCAVGITFTPAQAGNLVDQLTLTSSSLHAPLTVSLSGSGEDFQLSVVGSSSQTITSGQTATYQIAVTPVGASAGTLTFSCSGAPANSSCTFNPTTVSVAGGAAGSVTATITTGLPTIAWRCPAQASPRALPERVTWAIALLLPCLFLRGRSRRTFLGLVLTLALVLAPTACGVHASGGSTGVTTGTTGTGSTPSGTSTVTLTASFPGAQRSVTVTLVVQ